MSTDRPPTPPLDLIPIAERMQAAMAVGQDVDDAVRLLAEVTRLRADLAACRAVVGMFERTSDGLIRAVDRGSVTPEEMAHTLRATRKEARRMLGAGG